MLSFHEQVTLTNSCHHSYARQSVQHGNPGSVSGPLTTVWHFPWSAPFPPRTPLPLVVRHCSPASQVLRGCLTSWKRTCRHYGIAPSSTDPLLMKRIFPGSPGFREVSVHSCSGSRTPWRRQSTRGLDYADCTCSLPTDRTWSARAK